MNTVEGVYRALEEQLKTYEEHRITELLSPHNSYKTDTELFIDIGKAQASREIIKVLRNTLGYNVEDLYR